MRKIFDLHKMIIYFFEKKRFVCDDYYLHDFLKILIFAEIIIDLVTALEKILIICYILILC